MNLDFHPFPKFLQHRFSPCVFCVFSHEVISVNPGISKEILETWKNVMKQYRANVRMVFPYSIPNINTAVAELLDMRNIYPNTTPFFYVENEASLPIHGEIHSIQLLRQRLFEADFLPFYCFPDIPIAIIIFRHDREKAGISLPFFPKWSQKPISSVHPTILQYPCDLESVFCQFYETIYLENLSIQQNNLIQNYNKTKNNKSKFFRNKTEPTDSEIYSKYYADYLFQVGCFDEAQELYSKLYETSLSQQCYLMSALCEISMEKCSKSTLRLFERALIDNTNEIEVFGINTAQFFVECSLERAKRLSNYSKKFIILKPFLTEQFASFLNRKRCAFKLYQASIDYNELKCYEHSHMCMMTAFNLINENGFELLKTELLKGLFKVYPDGRYPLKKILGERLLSDPSFLQKVLRVNPPNEVVNCGFIQTRVVRFVSKGFAATVPDGYSESWPKTAQQLFGAFRNGEFFNYNALKVLECSGNEPLIIDVFCKSNCPIFHFKNVKIEAECDFELKQKAQEIEGENSLIRFEVYTKGNGIINFKGLTFDWENIHFRSCFSNNDIIFQSYIEASSVKLDVELPKDQLYIGEIIQIKCTLTNSEIPLKHLGMVVSGSIKFSVNSDTDEICGQRFLTPLQPNEKCEITISVVGESPGEYDLFLIFPFWSSKPPVRYVSHHITFVIRSFSDYYIKSINNQLRCEAPPSFEAIGFSSSLFDVSYHTSIIGKTKAVLDFISTSSDRVELVLPSYCESFSDGDEQIRFWCRSDCSFLFMPFFCSENCFVGLISHIDRSLYSIEFRNISNVGIKDFKVSIVEPNERITFIVSGNQIKSIDVLMPEQSIKYRVNILRLTEEVNLLLMVSGELFSVYKSVSLNK